MWIKSNTKSLVNTNHTTKKGTILKGENLGIYYLVREFIPSPSWGIFAVFVTCPWHILSKNYLACLENRKIRPLKRKKKLSQLATTWKKLVWFVHFLTTHNTCPHVHSHAPRFAFTELLCDSWKLLNSRSFQLLDRKMVYHRLCTLNDLEKSLMKASTNVN